MVARTRSRPLWCDRARRLIGISRATGRVARVSLTRTPVPQFSAAATPVSPDTGTSEEFPIHQFSEPASPDLPTRR